MKASSRCCEARLFVQLDEQTQILEEGEGGCAAFGGQLAGEGQAQRRATNEGEEGVDRAAGAGALWGRAWKRGQPEAQVWRLAGPGGGWRLWKALDVRAKVVLKCHVKP